MSNPGRTVISLGGSLVVPDAIDIEFLKSFKVIIEERIKEGEQFIIIIGGGKPARNYMQAGRELAELSTEDLDWIGIHATRLNAQFVRIVFGDLAHPDVVMDPTALPDTPKPIVFGAGWEPGWSTDYDAVMMAKQAGAKKILNLSNTNYVYDKDPKVNPDAHKLTDLSWEQYRAIIPAEWQPGLSTPFDPIASKEAHALGLEVMIINGIKLDDVKKCLAGQPFDGTTIHP